MEDAIRAAKKPYFDPKKLMKVYMHVSRNFNLDLILGLFCW